MSENLFGNLGTGERIIKLLKSTEEYGGPQSLDEVVKNLGMSNSNARSALSKMSKSGKIDRIKPAVYRAKGDSRDYDPNKPHYGG